VRAVPAGPSVEHAVHLDDRLVERAIGRAEWNRQSDRDATSSRTRLERVREEAGYSGGVGLEEDVLRPDLAVIRRERRVKRAAEGDRPSLVGRQTQALFLLGRWASRNRLCSAQLYEAQK